MANAQTMTTRNSTLDEWTAGLAESSGSPGGGAASGVMLAIAASLTSMVAGYSASNEHKDQVDTIRARAERLRMTALTLADEDAAASKAFGSAFRLDPGEPRSRAIRDASVAAAAASARLGTQALTAIDDLSWLARNGNPALISDVVVGLGALRAALTGARTNVSFDLGSVANTGRSLKQVRKDNPALWQTVDALDAGIAQIDQVMALFDDRAAPTDRSGAGGPPPNADPDPDEEDP